MNRESRETEIQYALKPVPISYKLSLTITYKIKETKIIIIKNFVGSSIKLYSENLKIKSFLTKELPDIVTSQQTI